MSKLYQLSPDAYAEQINKEKDAVNNFEQRWGFVKGKLTDILTKEEICKLIDPCRPPIVIPDHLKLPECSEKVPKGVVAKPSPKPFPQTTAAEIGWRAQDRELLLELTSPPSRMTFLRSMNWPMEAVD